MFLFQLVDIKVWYKLKVDSQIKKRIANQLKRTTYANQTDFLMAALIKSVLISGE